MTDHHLVYEGKNVALGAMQREYVRLFMPHANNVEATEGTRMIPPYTLEDEESWYDNIAKHNDNRQIFAILKKTTDSHQYIGHTSLFHITWPDAHGTTATLIFKKDEQGRGVGTEAKLLLMRHGFLTMGLRKMCSEVKAFNGQSLGHLLKCGYQIVGRSKEHYFWRGTYVDRILLEVFREDFESRWAEFEKTKKLPELTDEQRTQIKEIAGEP